MKKPLLKSVLTFLAVFCIQFTNAQLPLEYVYTNHLGGFDEEYIVDLKTDSEENVYVLIKSLSDEIYWNDSLICDGPALLLIKYNSEDQIVFNTPLVVSGDNAYLDVSEIAILNNGEIVLPGGFYGSLQFGDTLIHHLVPQGFICKFLNDGTPVQINNLEYQTDIR